MRASAFFLAIVIACLAAPHARGQLAAAESFASGFAKVRELTERGDYREAKQALLALIDQHGEHDYVRSKLPEIEEELRRCAFRIAYPPPQPKQLVSGELLSYNHFTGEIKVRYKQDRLADFESVTPADGGNTIHVHRARFDGPYSITLKGEHYPASEGALPLIWVDVGEGTTHAVVVGGSVGKRGLQALPSVVHVPSAGSKVITQKPESPAKSGEKWVFIVSVGESRIDVTFNGKTVMQATKATRGYARAGFSAGDFTEVVLDGDTDRAWMKGLIDAASQTDRVAFEKVYNPRTELPAWLAKGATPAPESAGLDIQFSVSPVQRPRIDRIKELIAGGDLEAARRYIDGLADAALPPIPRRFYLTQIDAGLGDYDAALDECHGLARAAPEMLGVRRIEAQLLLAAGRAPDALVLLQRLDRDHAGDAGIVHDLARALIVLDRGAEARAALEQARARGCWSSETEQLETLMVKAARGPSWSRSYEHRSKHYHVRSDIDMKTCAEAAALLEKAHAAFVRDLTMNGDSDDKVYPVYVFSSEAGYEAYAKEAFEFAGQRARTVGLYSQVLKQLLMLKVPDQDSFRQIVVHEGFHQYLDSIVNRAPRWLDEGLAQYYQNGDYSKRPAALGQPDRAALDVLKEKSLPLARLLASPPEEFFSERAQVLYAESWAFVHFLRHGGPAARDLFRTLMQKLEDGTEARAAQAQALADRDLEQLERTFTAYVRALPR